MRLTKQAFVQEKILEAATNLIAAKGFRAVTINDIAASLGYTKSVVYYYFKNKNEVLWQIFKRIHETYDSMLTSILEQELKPHEIINQVIYNHSLIVMKQTDWTTIYSRDENELSENQQKLVKDFKRDYDKKIEAVYDAGVKAKDFKDVPSFIALSAFMGVCNWLHNWYHEGGQLSAEEIAAYCVEMLASGYRAE